MRATSRMLGRRGAPGSIVIVDPGWFWGRVTATRAVTCCHIWLADRPLARSVVRRIDSLAMDVVRHLPLSQTDRAADAAIPDRRILAADLVRTVDAAEPTGEEGAQFLATCNTSAPSLTEYAAALTSAKRMSTGAFLRIVRAALVFADGRETPLTIDPRTLGVAALAGSASAPSDRRAAIAGYTVRATDAAWSFGRGPEATASALEIVRFLTGLSDEPPRPPRLTSEHQPHPR